MKTDSKKQVDILSKICYICFETQEGDQVHFRNLVSLSPAMQQGPLIEKCCYCVAISLKKRASKTLCVDETIEESNYVQGLEAQVFPYTQQKHSDTILNSSEKYPIKSNITTHKKETVYVIRKARKSNFIYQ